MTSTQTITQTRSTPSSLLLSPSHTFSKSVISSTQSTQHTPLPSYTWQQVADHNTATSIWCISGHYVYDITHWLKQHPGGEQVILLSAGRDITDLLISYHPFSQHKVNGILNKYVIGTVITHEYPQFTPDTGFYTELRRDVATYFKQHNIDHKSAKPGMMRLAVFMAAAVISYMLMCQFHSTMSMPLQWLLAVTFGVFQALPLLHAMHDASHCSIGKSEHIWNTIGFVVMDLFAGASMTSWLNQHVLGHHIYTNITGSDPDLPAVQSGDLRRIARTQKYESFYQFQYIYLIALYGVLAVKFRIQDITETFTKQMNGSVRVNLTTYTIVKQILTKFIWFMWRIAVPMYYFDMSMGQFWTLFVISEYVTGAYLTFNFQVSHISPSMSFPNNFDNRMVQRQQMLNEWAVHQCATSLDYSPNNPIVDLLCGALNYQVEHHLFPSVSQYHYPNIAPIVRAKCAKYQVPYHCVDSFYSAFGLHMQHLKTMGFDALHAE